MLLFILLDVMVKLCDVVRVRSHLQAFKLALMLFSFVRWLIVAVLFAKDFALLLLLLKQLLLLLIVMHDCQAQIVPQLRIALQLIRSLLKSLERIKKLFVFVESQSHVE